MFKKKPVIQKMYRTFSVHQIGKGSQKTFIYGYETGTGKTQDGKTVLMFISPEDGKLKFDIYQDSDITQVNSNYALLMYNERICQILQEEAFNTNRKERIENTIPN
jgi:ABC-type oligopeptide transport system ATPase subunit